MSLTETAIRNAKPREKAYKLGDGRGLYLLVEEQKKQEKRATSLANSNSFEAVGRERFLKFSASWAASHSSKVLLRFENNLFPWLGPRPIRSLEAVEILEALRPNPSSTPPRHRLEMFTPRPQIQLQRPGAALLVM
jgi:hypothetical protein